MSDCANHIANLRATIHSESFQPGQALTAARELDFTLQAAAQAIETLNNEEKESNPSIDGIATIVGLSVASASAVIVAYFLNGYSSAAQQQMLSMVYKMNLDLAEIVERIRGDEKLYRKLGNEFELFAEAIALLIQRLQGQSGMFPPTGPYVKGLIDVIESIKSSLTYYLLVADPEDPEGQGPMFEALVGQNGMLPNILRTLRTRC
ncbi:MAG: hypothetical protein OEM82_08955 [Acidobacteriota bacterium]|nr:hypothetical protein [Acidobacteriota bacterium]MDH3527930.1 hypothetical protein [Acidobacteriota bacterium]